MTRRYTWRCRHCWASSGRFSSLMASTRAWGNHQRWFHPDKYYWLRKTT